LVEALSYKSYDVAAECLVLGRDVLPAMGREREPFLSMSRALIEGSWREVKSCLEVVPKALQQIDESQTGRFLKLGERLAKVGLRDTSRFLSDGTQALSKVPGGSQGYILDLCETLLASSPEAVPAFLKSLSDVLNRINITQLDVWFQHGAGLLKENTENYSCDFVDDFYHGQGTYRWPGGQKFVGGFFANDKHGYGTYFYSTGTRREQLWNYGDFVH